MVDGVLLLVDASEGPLPQTRFVLRKALEDHLPVILVVNKVDRPDARIAEVVDEVYELFIDLDAHRGPDRVPDRLHERQGRLGLARPTAIEGTDLKPLMDLLRRARSRRPSTTPDHPLQAHVTNLDASPYVGRLAICRVRNGTIQQGRSRSPGAAPTAAIDERRRSPSSTSPRRSTASTPTRPARARSSPSPACPTSRSARRSPTPTTRAPLPVITVDEPSLSASRSASTPRRWPARTATSSPPARSRTGSTPRRSATSRSACSTTERPDTWEVQGRGELQLAILVEMMRREGFELTVGKPQVVIARDRRQASTSRSSG